MVPASGDRESRGGVVIERGRERERWIDKEQDGCFMYVSAWVCVVEREIESQCVRACVCVRSESQE